MLTEDRFSRILAVVKSRALAACRHSYVLADVSKFGVVSNVCFAGIEEAKIIGTEVPEAEWARRKNLILVK